MAAHAVTVISRVIAAVIVIARVVAAMTVVAAGTIVAVISRRGVRAVNNEAVRYVSTEAVIAGETVAAKFIAAEVVISEPLAPELTATEPVRAKGAIAAVESKAPIEIERPIETCVRIIEVGPGADADEHAVNKIIWAVIAVRRAVKRVCGIEAVFADRRRVVEAVRWADLNADGNLCL